MQTLCNFKFPGDFILHLNKQAVRLITYILTEAFCSFRVHKVISQTSSISLGYQRFSLYLPHLSPTAGHFHLGVSPPAIPGLSSLSCSLWVPFHGLLCDVCGRFPEGVPHPTPLSPPGLATLKATPSATFC